MDIVLWSLVGGILGGAGYAYFASALLFAAAAAAAFPVPGDLVYRRGRV